MKHKWKLFIGIIVACLLGTIAATVMSYSNPAPSNSSPWLESLKTCFLCLGGMGIILPIYLNATSILEARSYDIIENTYLLIEKWDDPYLFSARKLTRDIRDARSSLSDDDLVKKIRENDELMQSVILVSNYFEKVRFSVVNGRIDVKQFKSALGLVIIDIINRFSPYFKTFGPEYMKDFDELRELMS